MINTGGSSMKMMKFSFTRVLVGLCMLGVICLSSTPVTGGDRFSELAELPFVEYAATDATAKTLLEELYFQRACQVYLWALPAMNTVAMKEGSAKAFGSGYNVMPVWRKRLDSKTLVTTPNSDVVYAMAFLDLRDDGPMVVEVGAGLQGILDDFWQRPLTGPLTDNSLGLPTPDGKRWFGDVGLVGPDEGRGGKYIVLPPDYKGAEPQDGYVFRSRTYGVFIFWRAFFQDPADLSKPVAAMEATKIYPLGKPAVARPMQFPEGSGVTANLLYPRDSSYFDMLSRFIDREYVDPAEMDMRGMLASIGIVKGKAFKPTTRQREILDRAALTAFKIGKAMTTHGIARMEGGLQWPDRQYINAFIGGSPFFYADTYMNLDNRTLFFLNAYSASPAMAINIVGMGAKYPATFRDADGDLLSGGKSYKLHLPTGIPAKLFWSVTVYDGDNSSGLDNGKPLPSINSMDRPKANADGSIDIYFGPEKPKGADNWLRTVPGKSWFILLRLYGPEKPYFDDIWKPDDIVKVN
jgi:hypothetical protein